MKYNQKTDITSLKNPPKHIAFIMDGNGRWATNRLLPRKAGHKKGVDTMKKIVNLAFDIGIENVSVYAFSTENRNRPDEEKKALFELIEDYFSKYIEELIQKKIKIVFMGDLSYFPKHLQNIFIETMDKSAGFSGKIFNIGLNYGSRNEIVNAVNKIVEKGQTIDEDSFGAYLYTHNLPDPDLIVRTGGEQRLSNFMLYQAAYSELFFTKILWPDFSKKDLMRILVDFSNRNRRFGRV